MSNNGINYPIYNNLAYPHIVQQPYLYNQRCPNRIPQAPMPQYNAYPVYSNPAQYNSYDHIIQSAAETLAAFTHPSEQSTVTNYLPSRRSNPKTYYCEICRVGCGGQTSYQAHLNGTKHKKKESNALVQQSNSKTFRCELCDITCTSSDAYQAHLDGSKHDRAMKLHRKLGKTIPESQSTVVSNEEKQLNNSNSSFIGIEYIETTLDTSNNVKSFFCKLCNCKFHDINGRDAHLKGKRHRLSYKKKVNPNFQVETQPKSSSPKPIEPLSEQPQPLHMNTSYDIDDQTKSLMNLHEQIIPSKIQLEKIEEFIHLVESALKSASEQLSEQSPETISKSLIMGVSRVGLFVKNLLIKTDRVFQLVIVCSDWPKRILLEQLSSLLIEHFPELSRNQIHIDYQQINDLIEINANTDVGPISIRISFTSPVIQQDNQEYRSEEFLTKTNCLKALNTMESVRWFQNHVSKRPYALPLIRCLRYKTIVLSNWQCLSSDIIEILLEQILSKSPSPVNAFRRFLEYLSGGLVLSNNSNLRIPWEINPSKTLFDHFDLQQRNNITFEAQIALRLMSFGQLNQWLEKCDMTQINKRLYTDYDAQNSAKRQCTESIKIQTEN